MSLQPQIMLQPFEKWAINFVGPITPRGKIDTRYIIIAIEYLTRWAKAQPVEDCTVATAVKFLFQYVLTRFGCPKILMSNQGMHFLNETISALIEEFEIYHQQSMPYHPQAKGIVEAFNKILETALTKVCNTQRNDWDLRIPIVLWTYRTMCKSLTGQTPFQLIYGKEVVIPMEYIVPSLRIVAITSMADCRDLEERLAQLAELEEEQLLARFHQKVQKQHEKAWHDRHIKVCTFKENDLILLCDNKFEKFPRKL